MTERTSSLRTLYSGYLFDHTLKEDTELTHVGPGTPAGEYFRRFWHPVAMSEQLKDGLPLALRVLGENLVLFQKNNREIGLLHKHCSHRGTSLEFGIVEKDGLRCCYHGWLYGVDGRILETPGEPPQSRIKDRLCHGAYYVKEFKGLIFAYMGPPEEKPDFPILDTFEMEGDELVPYSLHSPCNWLQISENGADPFHSPFLHERVSGPQFGRLVGFGELPICEWYDRPFGSFYTNARRVGDNIWIRMHDNLLPNFGQAGSLFEMAEKPRYFGRPSLTRWVVPLDNENSRYIAWRHFNDRDDPLGDGCKEEVGFETVDFYGQTAHRSLEERHRKPGDWDAWVTQGPINVHRREHLGQTDVGIARLRRKIRDGIRLLQAGERPVQPHGSGNGPVPTYGGDTVIRMPKTNADDTEVIKELAGKVARLYQLSETYQGGDRREYLERELSKLSVD